MGGAVSDQDGESRHDFAKSDDFITNNRYTRRDVLRVGAGLAALITLGPVGLSACGTGSSSSSSSTSSTGPKKGGDLKVGLLGMTTADYLEAMIGTSIGDECLANQIYDQLMTYSPDQKTLVLKLAESF